MIDEAISISPVLDCSGLFDSHAHYFDKRFFDEADGADRVLKRDVFGCGIEGVINVGTNNENSRICIAQAAQYEKMYAAVGIHPEDTAYCAETLETELALIYELIKDPYTVRKNKIVALGEIGLDYHYGDYDRERQKTFFEYQLCMAEKLELPVIVHDREAHGDCFDIVLRHSNVRGVFHSYSGSPEMARELVKHGWYVSFSGVLTFKNAKKTAEVAKCLPLERILLETDCPYLAPHPMRGRINHSGLMRYTADRLAEILELTYTDVARITRANTKELFGV